MATFKTRARALDMLGRQQIAGRPTAISELFKNAHDAYADQVIVDYFRTERLFILRDDGLGMTREDFETRWLTLGTESKVGAGTGLYLPPIDPTKPKRPIMGEKGIGRLAIASIGPQVLILTRAKRENHLHDLVAAFINWGIFECPGIDMDQISFPVCTFPGGTLPTAADVANMVEEVRFNIHSLERYIDAIQIERMYTHLDSFHADPAKLSAHLGHPALNDNGHGTHFYIHPADDSLEADIDGSGDDDTASHLFKMLVGFTNTMVPSHKQSQIQVSFRDHKSNEICNDLIGENAFFTPEEFKNADHHFTGRFDECGQFKGTVTVYRNEPVDYVVPWLEARGRKTDCGPFTINIAYVQGEQRASALPPEEWALMIRKLNKIGGLYIYKDGVRVLPYGNTDYDFLDIERNRTKSASYYYFSYRRMFGVINLTHTDNAGLNEKAGREGFRENKAYRQFRDILKSFFVQIASDFFREGGVQAALYVDTKAELEQNELIRREREKLASVKRRQLRESLDVMFQKLDAREPEVEIEHLLDHLQKELNAALQLSSPDRAAQMFIELESKARKNLEAIRTRYRVVRPQGIGLPKQLLRDWTSYVNEYRRLETEVFTPSLHRIDDIIGRLSCQARLVIDIRRRIERGIRDQIDQALRMTSTESREARQVTKEISAQVLQLTRQSMAEVDSTMKSILSEFARLDLSTMDEAAVVNYREILETRVASVADQKRELLESVQEQLRAINLTPNEQGKLIGINETSEALEEELLAVKEQLDMDIELSQLGMAIGVINHEFEHTIKSVRHNLRRLKAWADVNESLRDLYTNIRASFDHLDSYLALFTPLQRRLTRHKVEIKGHEIATFLKNLFEERMRRHEVELHVSTRFLSSKLIGFPSTFYPVFVNLVDNAIYWLKETQTPRIIQLDTQGEALLVTDTGPGVPERDREVIFELGFTRKPGGRGLGLHISRKVLRDAGYRLVLENHITGKGAAFRIEPCSNEEKEVENL